MVPPKYKLLLRIKILVTVSLYTIYIIHVHSLVYLSTAIIEEIHEKSDSRRFYS